MVRKTIVIVFGLVLALFANCEWARAAEVYEGTISTTYLTYYKDLSSNIGFNDDYVFFRSGQYEYTMVVGDLEYNGSSFSLVDSGTSYVMSSTSNYNSYYAYSVQEITDFSLTPNDLIVYSNLGGYPELIERGSKYETITLYALLTSMFYVFISRLFKSIR